MPHSPVLSISFCSRSKNCHFLKLPPIFLTFFLAQPAFKTELFRWWCYRVRRMFGAVVWGEGWRGKYISVDNVVTCPRCKIYQSRHQGCVTSASHWSARSQAGLWLADGVPRGKLSVAEPPSQDNHTPSHPNGHKNPANGEMSPRPDQTQTLQQMQDKDIYYLVSQPPNLHEKPGREDVRTPETTQKHVWAPPGAWPGAYNHLICLSDKNMKLLSIRSLRGKKQRILWWHLRSDVGRRPLMSPFIRTVNTRRR